MAHHSTPSQRATAVARVIAGESRRKVAKEMGVSDRTVRGWLRQAEDRETPQAQSLADRAAAIAGEIEHWETIALHRLASRIADLAEKADDLAAATNAYAKLSDKALLRKGNPTAINEVRSHDQMDREIEQLMAEMAERAAAGATTHEG